MLVKKESVKVKEFVDFKGLTHTITIVGIVGKDEILDIYSATLGVSICHPSDVYDYDKGYKLALKNGRNFSNKYYVNSSLPNVFTDEWLNNWIDSQINYIIENPGVFIKGYNYACKCYKKKQEVLNLIDSLSPEESIIYDYICSPKSDKYNTLNKLISLQK